MIELNDDLVKILGMPTMICLQIAHRLERNPDHIIGPTTLHKTAYVKAWFLNMYEIYQDKYEKECAYALEQCDLNRSRIIT